ncbi:MAG: TetR family transcriptional regulator [Alphaproteobacteria bacterium]|nr:TetR family transcriptional regulator [Alphaproteobacteria bacterium]
MTKAAKNEDARLCAAALRLAAAQGWERITLDKVAKAAKLPVAKIKARFKTANGLVPVIAAEIDREAFAVKTSGGAHDRLFDLLMARFDILQKHRKAVASIESTARRDRALACILSRAAMDGAYRLIEAGKLDGALPRPVVAVGLIAVSGWAFAAWRTDKSRDMAKTMAALDRALRWADRGVAFLTQCSSRAKA